MTISRPWLWACARCQETNPIYRDSDDGLGGLYPEDWRFIFATQRWQYEALERWIGVRSVSRSPICILLCPECLPSLDELPDEALRDLFLPTGPLGVFDPIADPWGVVPE